MQNFNLYKAIGPNGIPKFVVIRLKRSKLLNKAAFAVGCYRVVAAEGQSELVRLEFLHSLRMNW